MPRGRPITPITKQAVRTIVKSEIEKALSQLNVKVMLTGTKRKGRPVGTKLKKKAPRNSK